MSLVEAQERINSREFEERRAMDRMERPVLERIELLLARFLAMYVNVHKSADQPPSSAADFMPQYSTPQTQSPEEMRRAMGG